MFPPFLFSPRDWQLSKMEHNSDRRGAFSCIHSASYSRWRIETCISITIKMEQKTVRLKPSTLDVKVLINSQIFLTIFLKQIFLHHKIAICYVIVNIKIQAKLLSIKNGAELLVQYHCCDVQWQNKKLLCMSCYASSCGYGYDSVKH